jgi:hypothetical protein
MPRLILCRADHRIVAIAAAAAGVSPRQYVTDHLVPLAVQVVASGAGLPGFEDYAPSGSVSKEQGHLPRAITLDVSDHKIVWAAAKIEGLTLKGLGEKYLMPQAKADLIALLTEIEKEYLPR